MTTETTDADADKALAPFAADLVADVAAETNIEPAALRTLLARHQRSVAEFPGTDDLYYEWRRLHPTDPLVVRTADAYVLAVNERVWDEFADALDLTDVERDQLRRVHDRQARRLGEREDGNTTLLDDDTTIGVVLARF